MEKLSNKEVIHVANLARLNVGDFEMDKYRQQLTDILSEIEKIVTVSIKEDNGVMIAPTNNHNVYKEDSEGPMLTKEEIFKNTTNNNGVYIVVPKVIND